MSSDDDEILACATKWGAVPLLRSGELSADDATSEEKGWLDVLEKLREEHKGKREFFALQATSPIRDPFDFETAYHIFKKQRLDALFSVEKIRITINIEERNSGLLGPSNFEYSGRGMRQKLKEKYLENGSFYLLNTEKFLKKKVRHFGKIGVYEMSKYKSIQIDTPEDLLIAEALMQKFAKC